MGIINAAANIIHRHQQCFTSNLPAKPGSWGSKDGHLFEYAGNLSSFGRGVPDPVLDHPVSREELQITSDDVTVSKWTAGAKVPGGLASLKATVEFKGANSVYLLLSEWSQTSLKNVTDIDEALAEVYRDPGKAWRLSNKWVSSSYRVTKGILIVSQEKDTSVTITGTGVISAYGVPVKLNLEGAHEKHSKAILQEDLSGAWPFVELRETCDPIWSRAYGRQVG